MNKEELKENLGKIFVDEKPFGLEVYAVLKQNNNLIMKKFLTTDELNARLSYLIKKVIEQNYLLDEIELEASDNISDNKKNCIYDILVTEAYDPFSVINDYKDTNLQYDEEDSKALMGFLFRMNFNDNHFWAYQQVYPVTMLKKRNSVYAVIAKNKIYDELKKDIIAIGSRIDLLVLGQHIITGNIGLLQNKFGFEKYIRQEARFAIDIIVETGIVTDPEILVRFSSKEKLTNAKKLMKAKNSPVLRIEKTELINRIGRHSRYSSMIRIDNGEIQLGSEKDVNSFIKLLNDDIVRSELTETEYDSISKRELEPV